ncbi:MAG: chitobiase/beta-hexosaminidase C-terminal domain-containing protein [Bacteroidales bacterium]|nr:chitobiase/beta-hexosaminidase C-terminal domain-containing protein [Bacteroidales bacterium]
MLKKYYPKVLNYRFYIFLIALMISAEAKSQTTADPVDYNFKRGFYTDSFKLVLSTKTPGGTIRYTLDGSKPSLTNGQDYSVPISISANAMVRAYTYATGLDDSKIKTHTYIFPQQVIRQKDNMLEDYGYDFSSEETGKVFWTEEMDPEIVEATAYKDEIIQGLKDIPTLSVVMLKEDLWGSNGIHWGDNLEEDDIDFERECSIEMIYPDGYKGDTLKNWQENCGIKIQGGGGRWDKGTYDHKQSFTLVFRKIYGAGKLKNEIFADAPHGKESTAGKYDRIILRSGHNKGWGSDWDREKSVYTRDQLGRDLQILMSGFGSHGTFVHLYLNGKYWGLYNPCERPDHNFLANYFGGEDEDYFYAKGKEDDASDDRDGEPGQSSSRFYEANSKDYSNIAFTDMQNWVMVDQSIASFLVYGYSNPGDGPQYYYGNNNNPPGPVVWIPWDIEDSFGGGSRRTGDPSVSNMLDDNESGDNGFEAFWTNIDFRMRFNDLVYKHFYNDGVMTDENVIKAWDNLTNYIYRPIICESARWGDERSSDPMDRDNEWDAARLAVRKDLNGRGGMLISKLQDKGYYSTLPAPSYSTERSETDTSTFSITISRVGDNGVVYYSTDNTDPRTWDLMASVSASAIMIDGESENITVMDTFTLMARTKDNNEWSPLHKVFVLPDGTIIHDVSAIDEIVITEIDDPLNNKFFKDNKKKELLLYPNPVSDRLYLSEEKEFSVYSAMGRLILNGKGSEIIMDYLPKGMYIIVIDNLPYRVLKRDYY